MKRIVTLMMAVLMIASAAVATVYAGEKVDGRKTAEAYIATDITVDGKIEDSWKYANSYKVDVVKTNFAKDWYKDTMKSGVDYASMNVKVLWDGKATLYVLAEVSDKTPNHVADSTWLRDSIDLFFNWSNANAAGSKKDSQVRIYADGSNASSVVGLKTAVTVNKGSWIMEYAVDATKAGGVGKYVGIDFQYNDNILGKKNREVCLGWSDKEDKASSDATVYGQCLLSAKKVADIKAAQTTAATTKAPAAKPSSPATFDAGIILAVAAAAAGAGVVVSKKRK